VIVLTGKVRGLVNGRSIPLSGAAVELRDGAGVHATVASVISDSNGIYAFTNPDASTGQAADIPSGHYTLYAAYRAPERQVATVNLRADRTSRRDIALGKLERAGGAAPPAPRPEFYVTDREAQPNVGDISKQFLNKRINDPCGVPADCMMHYGMVAPLGPILTDPGSNKSASSVDGLLAMLQAQYPAPKSTLIFIHGYNNNFFDPYITAATWLASYDPAMPVILYSWPSNHATAKYVDDETNNTWSMGHFRDFLVALLNDPQSPPTINILSHSMGNRLTIAALEYIASAHLQTRNHIGQVIFAAPDVDSGTFYEDIPKIAAIAAGVTIYGSTHDQALRLSRQLHGHCRAGLVGCEFDVPNLPNVNGIDASLFHCDFLGHGYWSASSTMQADIVALLARGVNTPSQVRPNLTASGASMYYFSTAAPDDTACASLPRN
jgi:hypothetical protein